MVGQKDRQADTKIDRQTDRTGRYTHTEKQRQTERKKDRHPINKLKVDQKFEIG
jgi:hypothetical protein